MTESHSEPTGLVGRTIAEIDDTGGLAFDAAVVGRLFGLPPDAFMEEVRKGFVYQTHERGTDEDSGKTRVTFRYRSRQSVLTLDEVGRVLSIA